MVVLSQYNSEYINTGNNKLYVSNEDELNSSIYSNNAIKQKTNLCTLINGMPSCKYTFNNVDITDSDNNIYYYKIGISAIYDNGNSKFVTPYNITKAKTLGINGNTTNMPEDSQYELIKSQLGNYPSNLLMDSQSEQNLLRTYVDKSLAHGILNVNVK